MPLVVILRAAAHNRVLLLGADIEAIRGHDKDSGCGGRRAFGAQDDGLARDGRPGALPAHVDEELGLVYLPVEAFAYIAFALFTIGKSGQALISHPDWELFGMTPSEVAERLDGFGEHRGIIVQRAGSVVHFTWAAKSIEELIDVLAR